MMIPLLSLLIRIDGRGGIFFLPLMVSGNKVKGSGAGCE